MIEKAAYLKGYFEGIELDTTSKEGKVIAKLVDVIEAMAVRISELEELCDALDESLAYVEESVDILCSEVLDEDFDEDDDYLPFLNDEDEDYEAEEEDYYELDCPSCGETICFTADVDLETLACPACGELIGEIELSECDEDCENCPERENCEE